MVYDVYTESVSSSDRAKWQALFDTGRWNLVSHSLTHDYNNTNGGGWLNDYETEALKSQEVLRMIFPQPTEERRRELVKQVKNMGEDAKVAIRNVRRDANDAAKKAKKDGELTEDDVKNAEKAIQDLTDKYIKNVDAVSAKKEKEIMQI